MTMPETVSAPDGIQAQVLIELGKLSTAQAVANTKLDTLLTQGLDHEARLRDGERDRADLRATLDTMRAERSSSRDLWARVVAGLSAAAAIGSAAAVYLHK